MKPILIISAFSIAVYLIVTLSKRDQIWIARGMLLAGARCLALVLCVVLGSVADGLAMAGNQIWAHNFEVLEIVALLSVPVLIAYDSPKAWILTIVAYICFRIGFFDYVLNMAAGQDWTYVGESSWWDMFIKKAEPFGFIWFRAGFASIGTIITVRYL